jgi:xylulokinase
VLFPDDELATGGAPDDVFERLNAMAAAVPAGSNGVIFTPWLNGERTPVDNHLIRSMWFNLGLATTRADLVRAVFEGVALNTRWMMEAAEKFVRKQRPDGFEHITFVGGGARSDLWCQIHADVLDRPIRQVADPVLANARGAAFSAAVALGYLRWDDIPARIEVTRTYEPDPEHRGTYDRAFAAFVDLYKQNKSGFAKLNRRRRH